MIPGANSALWGVVLACLISRVAYTIIIGVYALGVRVLISPHIVIVAFKLDALIKQYLGLLIRSYYHYYSGIVLFRGLEGLSILKLCRVLFKPNKCL
jgi:hypothetical protein